MPRAYKKEDADRAAVTWTSIALFDSPSAGRLARAQPLGQAGRERVGSRRDDGTDELSSCVRRCRMRFRLSDPVLLIDLHDMTVSPVGVPNTIPGDLSVLAGWWMTSSPVAAGLATNNGGAMTAGTCPLRCKQHSDVNESIACPP
jgi:hypothetical protein